MSSSNSSSLSSSSSSSCSASSSSRLDEESVPSFFAADDEDSSLLSSDFTVQSAASAAFPTLFRGPQNVWKRIGVLGGGQLGRMLAEEARLMNVPITVLDPTKDCPASQVGANQIIGDFRDQKMIETLASQVDILTVEIEHVNCDALEAAAKKYGLPVVPSPSTLRTIQDKFVQKQHLTAHGIPTAAFRSTPSAEAIADAAKEFGLPLMLKSRVLAYDGKGNCVLRSATPDAIAAAIKELFTATNNTAAASAGATALPLYAERWADFQLELSVMVVRSRLGVVSSYPAVHTIHHASICHTCIAPAQVEAIIRNRAEEAARRAVATFEGAGVFGVELFLLKDGSVLVNEIAPRPHNSGHYTIEACHVSQYAQQLRVALDLPLGSTAMRVAAATMVNVLGTGNDISVDVPLTWMACEAALSVVGATPHWYGKKGVALKRKMAHVTFVGDSIQQVSKRVNTWQKVAQNMRKEFWAMKEKEKEKESKQDIHPSQNADSDSALISPWLGVSSSLEKQRPLVSIIMGSDSDLPTMSVGCFILENFGVPFEVSIVSAHRTPERMFRYASAAASRGLKVIIAGAGGAAHLPGMVAAITPLPVVGVPIPLSYLDGQDSLYSIVQMPRGVPVATVAIGNATNAALIAVRILGVQNKELLKKMKDYMQNMEQEVQTKIDRLEKETWKNYKVAHK